VPQQWRYRGPGGTVKLPGLRTLFDTCILSTVEGLRTQHRL
jgi:hypothetical protein